MALIPPFYFDCVSAIGVVSENNIKTWIGTGFLVGRFEQKDDEELYRIYFVTNKHIFKGNKSAVIRFNPQSSSGGAALDFPMDLVDREGNNIWIGHPDENVDVAVMPINIKVLEKYARKYSYFRSDKDVLSIKDMIENDVSEGDFVYALGFPMALVDADRQYVISRGGTIARIRDVFDNQRKDFIVDISIFPGNSGSPIVTKPEFIHIDGTKCLAKSALIGIVNSYLPYLDSAISPQTMRTRVTFEENSGLAKVIPSDYIMETIEISYKKVNEEMKIEDATPGSAEREAPG